MLRKNPFSEEKALLLRAAKDLREALRAKIALAQQRADRKSKDAEERLRADLSERGMLRSGHAIHVVWAAAVEIGHQRSAEIIDACAAVEVTDARAITDFVVADFKWFVDGRAHYFAESIPDLKSGADWLAPSTDQQADPLPPMVVSMLHDHRARQGTSVDRALRKLKNRPVVALAIVAYFVLSSVGGAITCAASTVETVQKLFSEPPRRRASNPGPPTKN